MSKRISRRRLLLGALPAAGVLAAGVRPALGQEGLAGPDSVPSDLFRTTCAAAARRVGDLPLAEFIDERRNCYAEIFPAIGSASQTTRDAILGDCLKTFSDVPNAPKLGEIIKKCFRTRWSESSPAVRALKPAAPSLDAVQAEMQVFWDEANSVISGRIEAIKATGKLEHVVIAQQTASFALGNGAADLVDFLGLDSAREVRLRTHFRYIAETAVFVAATSGLMEDDSTYDAALDALSAGRLPLSREAVHG